MAHPHKRMRLMEEVGAEQPSPETIVQQQIQSSHMQRTIAELEKKYGAIPETMTDEVDMRTGEIVVDRGHMRKWNREYIKKQGKRIDLVDDLFLNGTADLEEEEAEDPEYDERDELAPSESPEPATCNEVVKEGPETVQELANSQLALPPPASPGTYHPSIPDAAITTPNTQAPVMSAPAHSVNLIQLVQALHTPVGPQAQGGALQQQQDPIVSFQKFQQALTETISQTVAQTVTPLLPLLSALAQSQVAIANLNLPTPTAVENPVPLFATPAPPHGARPNLIVNNPVATGSQDPLSAAPASPKPTSPIRILPTSAATNYQNSSHTAPVTFQGASPGPILNRTTAREIAEPSPVSPVRQLTPIDKRPSNLTVPRSSPISGETPRLRRQRFVAKGVYVPVYRNRRDLSPPLYDELSEPDHQPERTSDMEDDQPVDDPQDEPTVDAMFHSSEQKGELAPEDTTNADADKETPTVTRRRVIRQTVKGKLVTAHDPHAVRASLQPPSPHLPTPSSLEHNEMRLSADQTEDRPTDDVEDLIASSGYFDDDERDLLSLYGDDEEKIWPSIEIEPQADSDMPCRPSVDLPIREKTVSEVKEKSPVVRKVPSAPSSTIREKRTKQSAFQVNSHSDDELDLSAYMPSTPRLPSRGATPKSRRGGPRKHESPSSRAPDPKSRSDASDEDAISLLMTPQIKRESLTPKPLASPALHTPQSAPQPTILTSSAAKPKGTPMPRSAYLKKVKQAWAKSRTNSAFSPRALAKAKSLRAAGQKRAWEELEGDDGSADELAF